jgi:hypothetical protein
MIPSARRAGRAQRGRGTAGPVGPALRRLALDGPDGRVLAVAVRSRRRSLVITALGGLLIAVAGCGGGASPTGVATAAPAMSQAPTATPAPPTAAPTATPPTPTAVPTPETSLPPFVCGETLRRPGTVPRAQITGLEVVNEDGVGRITFTFEPEGNVAAVPEVGVRPAEPPFTQDPSGMPLEVPGVGFVSVVLFGGTALDENFEPTFEGPFDVDPAGEPIVAFRRAGDFEAVSSFVAGLAGSPCVRVLPPDGTSRLVIEIRGE